MAEKQLWVPADRLLAIVDRDGRHPYVGKQSTIGRTLCRLRSGEQEFMSLEKVDEMLIQFGLEEWLRYPKEWGGLADIYEDEIQYGSPNHNRRPGQSPRAKARQAALRRAA